jgi:phosphate starvation-inducible PhoH-like protein
LAAKKHFSIRGIDQLQLFGPQDKYLRSLESRFNAKIIARGNDLILQSEESVLPALEKILFEMITMVNNGHTITDTDLVTLTNVVTPSPVLSANSTAQEDDVILYKKDGFVKPKSAGQRVFFESCQDNDIVFSIGPAGTGKTFLAVAIAVAALRDKLVNRIVLTRPAVEAGERLGFLPGDLREKVDPYLRPLYDALHDMIPPDKLKRYLESGIIEIVPLAYMRGRTLNSAFVILDEAQNTSFNQMKMFLTRLGISSKSIITGDVTQSDLPDANQSGLVQIQKILGSIEGIKFVYMSERDVVRHRLVREIIKAYDEYEGNNGNSRESGN